MVKYLPIGQIKNAHPLCYVGWIATDDSYAIIFVANCVHFPMRLPQKKNDTAELIYSIQIIYAFCFSKFRPLQWDRMNGVKSYSVFSKFFNGNLNSTWSQITVNRVKCILENASLIASHFGQERINRTSNCCVHTYKCIFIIHISAMVFASMWLAGKYAAKDCCNEMAKNAWFLWLLPPFCEP